MSNIEEKNNEVLDEEKSSAPAFTLEFCLSMIKTIVSQRGETPFSRKDAALILGKSESNISPKLGACGQYGIIFNDRGRGYKITALYNKIELYSSVEEKNGALLTALSNPPVYKKLIDDYNGKVLPANEDMFSNLLVSSYGMIKTSAEIAAKVFVRNAKTLGVIDSSNRLRFIMPVANGHAKVDPQDPTPPVNDSGNKTTPTILPGMVEILIPFKGGRKAYLHIPEDYTEEELGRVSKFVEALK